MYKRDCQALKQLFTGASLGETLMNRFFLNAFVIILGLSLWTTASAVTCRNRATGRIVSRAACIPNQEDQIPLQTPPIQVSPPVPSPPLAQGPAYPTQPIYYPPPTQYIPPTQYVPPQQTQPAMNNVCATQFVWCALQFFVPSGSSCYCVLNDGTQVSGSVP